MIDWRTLRLIKNKAKKYLKKIFQEMEGIKFGGEVIETKLELGTEFYQRKIL